MLEPACYASVHRLIPGWAAPRSPSSQCRSAGPLDLAIGSGSSILLASICFVQYATERKRLCVQPRQKIGRRLITLSYFDPGQEMERRRGLSLKEERAHPPRLTTNHTRYRCSQPRSSHLPATPWMILAMARHCGMALLDETRRAMGNEAHLVEGAWKAAKPSD